MLVGRAGTGKKKMPIRVVWAWGGQHTPVVPATGAAAGCQPSGQLTQLRETLSQTKV